MEESKYNLTVIDRDSEIQNIVYRGVSKENKTKIVQIFEEKRLVLSFIYDEGEAFISTDTVHTLVFADYLSYEEETAPESEEE